MENQNVRLALAFVVGLIIGLGLYWVFDRDSAMDINTSTDNLATTTVGVIEGNNGVVIGEQQPGKVVTVTDLRLEEAGWVAIRDDVNGEPGPKILGARLFDKGNTTGVVQLLRATEPGKSYFAILHTDDGNPKAFNSRLDKVLLDDSGKQIMVRFQVAGTAAPAPVTSKAPVIKIGGKE